MERMQILFFSLDKHRYGMPLSTGVQVSRWGENILLPKYLDTIPGIISVIGSIITSFSLSIRILFENIKAVTPAAIRIFVTRQQQAGTESW